MWILDLYPWLGIEMNRCLEGTDISEWMTKEETTLMQKDPKKTPRTIINL